MTLDPPGAMSTSVRTVRRCAIALNDSVNTETRRAAVATAVNREQTQ
jgi:hypothetical protein